MAAAILALAALAGPAGAAADGSALPYDRSRHMVAMRDGVRLSTDVYRPAGRQDTAQSPAILWRSVYGKENAYASEPFLAQFLDNGYFVVVQNTRGRGASEGSFVPSVGDRNDGYDTLAWIVAQPWSNGRVGTAGCSSLGEAQLLTAAARHPNHVAMVPQSAASGYNVRGRPWASFDGGVFELAQTAGWFSGDPTRVDYRTLPVVDILRMAGLSATEYENFASSNPEGDYFGNLEWVRPGERLDVPALFFDSWYDYGPKETLELFSTLSRDAPGERARANQFAIIFPYTHCGYLNPDHGPLVGDRDLGDARRDVGELMLRWYDFWLKGIDNGITDMPKVQYYLMGRNEWRSAPGWPVPGTQYEKLYLGSDGHANSLRGDGRLSWAMPDGAGRDTFVYDPGSPVPSLGGHVCCTGMDTEAGSYDQTQIEGREDVLVYTSDVLERPLEVTGPLEVILHVSSSAPDTDFTAKLVDVYPDGRAFNVQEGALRMRYREGFDRNLRMTPGEVYRIRLDLHVTSNYFDVGHRVRLEVSSSNFPRWDRNLNTGGDNFDETEFQTARNTVYHSAEHPSWILLPIQTDFYRPWEALGELYHDVEMAGVFADSKTFADYRPKGNPAALLDRYRQERDADGFDLERFVSAHFDPPLIPAVRPMESRAQTIEEHIPGHWDYLTRQPADEPGLSSLIPLPKPYVVPGGRFREIYYWDSYFTMLGLAASDRWDLIENMLDNFAYLIDTVGFVPNGNRSYFLGRSQPPYFSLMVRLYADHAGFPAAMKYLPQLEREYAFWMDGAKSLGADRIAYRRVVMPAPGVILNRYWDDAAGPRPESWREDFELAEGLTGAVRNQLFLDLRAACESGWDFSTRWLEDGGSLDRIITTRILPVDLNSLLYHLEATLERMQREAGNAGRADGYADRARQRAANMLRFFWDAQTGFFQDYDFLQQDFSGRLSLAGMYPFFLGIAEPEHAEPAAEVLRTHFLHAGGLTATPRRSGQQWDSPNGWPPLQWISIRGLLGYGQPALAEEIARRWVALNQKVYAATGKMMEKYDVTDLGLEAGGGEYPTQDGFGWTNGVAYALITWLEEAGRWPVDLRE